MSGTDTNLPALAERTDVHKSCKALEVLVNLLADYTEAAGVVVQLQKKLAKALREAAALKSTSNIASNALGSTANLFEILADINGKFSKLTNKECDTMSGDVKKWFKKLAKEEKAHDERINVVNLKIKQAGLSYERKAKKNALDAAAEHSRYIELLGTVGPELTQEKYNHAVFVTQRHTATTYNVAATLARIADAEWLRSCEGVRRFAPTVGTLTEWRVLCEGGWTGPRPKGLPDPEPQQDGTDRASTPVGDRALRRLPPKWEPGPTTDDESRAELSSQRGLVRTSTPAQPPDGSTLHNDGARKFFDGPISRPPSSAGQNPLLDPDGAQTAERKVGPTSSFSSLASFPAPPTHFPIPAVMTPTGHKPSPSFSAQPMSPTLPTSPRQTPAPPNSHRTPNPTFSTLPPVVESPARELSHSGDVSTAPSASLMERAQPGPIGTIREEPLPIQPIAQTDLFKPEKRVATEENEGSTHSRSQASTSSASGSRPLPIPKQSSQPATPLSTGHSSASISLPRGDYLPDSAETPERTFAGVVRSTETSKVVQRSDSQQSRGSTVASIRGKLTHSTAPSSPPPTDIPKLPFSVSEMASRYNGDSNLTSPRRTASPALEPLSPRLDSSMRAWSMPQAVALESRPPPSSSVSSRGSTAPSVGASSADLSRYHEIEDLERREREFALRQRERDVELRARELELERARLLINARAGNGAASAGDGYISDSGRSVQSSGRPERYLAAGSLAQGRYSYSTTHLVPPDTGDGGARVGSSSSDQSQRARSQPSSPVPGGELTDHAPFCGCSQCSIAKYRAPPSPQDDIRPAESPINLRPEKPKNWMRRLSMPVGAAFSLDSSNKKFTSVIPPSNRHSMSFIQDDGKSGRKG